jgi:peroxiredoxin
MINIIKTTAFTFYLLMIITTNGCAQNSDTLPDTRGFMVRLGNMAPDFTIEFTDGSPSKKLSEFRGKVVMLQFTASWCSVCIQEMPHIEKEIWQVYKDKGLFVFGVDRKEKKDEVLKFAKKTKVTYPLIMDEKGRIFEQYAHANAGVTRNVLIDKTGKIVFMTRLYDKDEFSQLVAKIKEIL